MFRPRIFLGSSAESLSILETVSNQFNAIGDCIHWTNAFKLNKSNLESLVRQTKLADYSILIAMKEDLLCKKENVYSVARDNVIFEFGLFLGATGARKAFLLAEDGIDLPSDLDGITISKFVSDENKFNSLSVKCQEITKEIQADSKGSDLGLLPSTALAIGYYHNFVYRLCEELHSTNKILVDGNELKIENFTLEVVMPSNIDNQGISGFKTIYFKKQNLLNGITATFASKRGYPFVFKLDPPGQELKDGKIIRLIDIPDTLGTVGESLKLFMPKIQVGQSSEVEHLEKRELRNFAKVLNFLVGENYLTKSNVFVKTDVEI